MTFIGWLQIALYFIVLTALVVPLGRYMARVFEGERTFLTPVFRPVEIALYRIAGVDETKEQHWLTYTIAALLFNAAGFALLYAILRLQAILPLPFVELSHLLASVVGVLLLILARGLARRFHSAWVATLALLGAGAVAALARGAELESALLMAVSALLLYAFRDAFYRRADMAELRLSPAWLAMTTAGVAAAIWLGFFSYRHVAYGHELWWQFEWGGDAPRFLRASVAAETSR